MAAKVSSLTCFILFRFLLPLILLGAAIVRFNALSFLYLICLLVTPLISYPKPVSMSGCTGRFLKILITLSSLAVLTHIVFQITLGAIPKDGTNITEKPYGSLFLNCSLNEKIVRQIGFQRLDGVPALHATRLILPDVIVLVISIVIFVVSKILISNENLEHADLPHSTSAARRRKTIRTLLNFLGEGLVMLFISASAIMVPSVLSSLYFILFIALGVLWACYFSLGKRFGYVRLLLLTYTGLHILLLHLYQFQFFQDIVSPDDFWPRLLGMTGIIATDCSSVSELRLHSDVYWWMYANPAVLLALFWVLAFETHAWFKRRNLPEDQLERTASRSRKQHHKIKKQVSNLEHQVEDVNNLNETGSLVFTGSRYGGLDDDEERLVEHQENINYNSIDPVEPSGESPADSINVDRTSIEPSPIDRNVKKKRSIKRPFLVSIFVYIMKQSYVLTLIVMMAWSIKYHSWLTFVLLLSACILWMLPNKRRACLVTSPFQVLYVMCLLIAQYIFNMNLKELPEFAGEMKISDIGLGRFKNPPEDLAIQMFFTLFFLMTLRQFVRERKNFLQERELEAGLPLSSRRNVHQENFSPLMQNIEQSAGLPSLPWKVHDTFARHRSDVVDGYDGSTIQLLGHFCWVVLCKYWIFVCAGMLLLMSISEVVIFRIIYMFLFVLFVMMFQVSYTLWRVLMHAFWWVVIIYSMILLIIIYTYQFEKFPMYWQNSTGFDTDTLRDIGLEKFGTAELFIKLLTPTSFLIVIILQLHYFHKPFLHLSALDRFRQNDAEIFEDSRPHEDVTTNSGSYTESEFEDRPKRREKFLMSMRSLMLKVSQFWNTFTHFIWQVAEIHFFKLVVIIVMVVCVDQNEVCALTGVLVVLLALLLPIVVTGKHTILSHLLAFWSCFIILAKMIYQLQLAKFTGIPSNCTNVTNFSSLPERSVSNLAWFGLRKIHDLGFGIEYYIRFYILILAVVLFDTIIRLHQRQYYNQPDIEKPSDGILFPEVQREDADKNIISCLKFFANYAFYKFGLEICYLTSAITISVRLDVYAVLYGLLLALMMGLTRRTSARVWWLYTVVLAILLPLQYFASVGFPPLACITYPWIHLSSEDFLERLIYLPDPQKSLPTNILMADFMQLLFVCLQWKVFRLENVARVSNLNVSSSGGGDNDEILQAVEANLQIPVEDFTVNASTYMAVCKQIVFTYFFWLTLAIVFVAGTTSINVFSFGYVIAVFLFMWYGTEFLRQPLRKLLQRWNWLITYCVFVLLAKSCLQLVGCVYINKLVEYGHCWMIQLCGINCFLSKESLLRKELREDCIIENDQSGLAWDVVCFAFLLFQRRIYSSHYFRHVVDLLEAQDRLSSRGAELINRILVREVWRQREQEKQVLASIKKKMHILKERQSKLKKDFKEPEEHYQAIRSGDYYLFDDEIVQSQLDPQSSVSLLDQTTDSLSFPQIRTDDEDKKVEKRLGPLQVISTAIDQGTGVAVAAVDQQDNPDVVPFDSVEEMPNLEDEKDKEPGIIKTWGNFFRVLMISLTDWIINLCNKISRNYRLVAQKLETELKIEKEKIKSQYRIRSPIELTILDKQQDDSACNPSFKFDESQESVSKTEQQDICNPIAPTISDQPEEESGSTDLDKVTVETFERATREKSRSYYSLDHLEEMELEREKFEGSQPRVYRLFEAIVYMLISHSELLCYFLMILDQMVYGSILSLPLPFMVFLWGMLSVPRPSKTFWITIITYTEAVVVTKYLFQFGFFPWNNGEVKDSPFFPPRILGIEQKDNFANVDIALLLALFIHRSILKKYGLWKDSHDITADMARAGEKERTSTCITITDPLEDTRDSHDITADMARAGEKEITSTSKTIINPIENTSLCEDSHDITADIARAGEKERTPTKTTITKPIENTESDESHKLHGDQMTPPSSDTSTIPVESEPKPNILKLRFLHMMHPFIMFFKEVSGSSYNATVDVYAPMFCCDFINFFIIVFGYQSFGPGQQAGSDDFTQYIRENNVPMPFLIILIVQFVFIITDRALFLRKNVLGKFIYQIFLVIFVHIWMFFILPSITNRSFYDNLPAQLWYFMKCVYFALSAYQIRCGYPTRILGNFLTKKYNYLNLYLFKGFLAVPFLLELRALMDWIWTDSTLAIGSWLQMEDIYANIFILKCWRHAEIKYPTPRAKKKAACIKYGVGGLLLFVIILIIWFPLLFFALINEVYESNPPTEATVQINLGGFQPLYKTTVWFEIRSIQTSELNELNNYFSRDRAAVNFISRFRPQDISVITMEGNSTSIWGINPPSQQEMVEQLTSGQDLKLQFIFSTFRLSDTFSGTLSIDFLSKVQDTMKLARLINGTSNDTVMVEAAFPRFMQLSNKQISLVSPLINGANGFGLSNLSLMLSGAPYSLDQHWSFSEKILGSLFSFNKEAEHYSKNITIVTFTDRKAPSALSFLTASGIIGLYVSFILVIGRVLRMSTTGQSMAIIFTELPHVDSVLQLCLDIYLVREMKEFRLEEDLYAKLIFLYRSPETMIKWTRYKTKTD